MSNLRQIAALIPAEYRKEIIDLDMIERAKAHAGDEPMHYLSVIWKNYIEPDFSPDCNTCYSRVLNNLKQMKHILIELEKENNLLNSA